jgi:transcriptional regulator with XRE-family HTH domain
MIEPDIRLHDARPAYIRSLLERAGLSQHEAAARLGITDRTMRNYVRHGPGKGAPYSVQFALEAMALAAEAKKPAVA